jgi:SpoVK/Ycf46/Vps4 family AAA+-type ATPase
MIEIFKAASDEQVTATDEQASPAGRQATAADEQASAAAGTHAADLLFASLKRLDHLLRLALAAAPVAAESEAAGDAYRGLYVSEQDAARLLAQEPCAPAFAGLAAAAPSLLNPAEEYPPRLARLARMYDLNAFDVDVMLLALAAEIDLRYERVFAYLQDDVTRKRPSVDLALNLLCANAADKLARRPRFAPDAPLVRQRLLHLLPDPHQTQPPLLAHFLKLDDQITRFLLEQDALDARLEACCRITHGAGALTDLPIASEIKRALPAVAGRALRDRLPLRLYFRGAQGAHKLHTAETLAHSLDLPLLIVDTPRALAAPDLAQLIELVFREARLREAVLYFDGFDVLFDREHDAAHRQLRATLMASDGIVILAGAAALDATTLSDVLEVQFPRLDFAQRRRCWHDSLRAHDIELEAGELDTLAGRFRLNATQIAQAVNAAAARARWQAAAHSTADDQDDAEARTGVAELAAAARAQSSHNLASLARKVEPRHTWADIVLPPDQSAQLVELCDQAKYRHVVYGAWGFERKLSLGKGLNALFAGPPGTGKTMAAEVIARELHLDLFSIDLSQVVSKYIGETEKNLDRVFREARASSAILFFDEADALFGKRSEVKDAHDRYANIEVGYLLQKMEEYDGVAILATNLRQHIDEAFVRRMHVIIEFPFPDEEHRAHIWRVIFPPEAPLAADVDFQRLARDIKLAGGNIRNIALAAAFYAAESGGRIGMAQLMRAARREHQKLGRAWSPSDWTEQARSES